LEGSFLPSKIEEPSGPSVIVMQEEITNKTAIFIKTGFNIDTSWSLGDITFYWGVYLIHPPKVF
jgi:hypothetical protein